ncbi:MAG: hypothetical protein U0Q16_10395 [Bryobacteraceae bacterium]
MARTKITITLQDGQLKAIRKRVATRKSKSVSGFIQRAVKKLPDFDPELIAASDETLDATKGRLTKKARTRNRSAKAA